jgi:hypothetical protein
VLRSGSIRRGLSRLVCCLVGLLLLLLFPFTD